MLRACCSQKPIRTSEARKPLLHVLCHLSLSLRETSMQHQPHPNVAPRASSGYSEVRLLVVRKCTSTEAARLSCERYKSGRVEMLDWDDLRFFLAIARSGSLSSAARELRCTQSTVGRRLASLEARLGVRLLNRTPRGYVVTQAGEGVREHVERIESEAL